MLYDLAVRKTIVTIVNCAIALGATTSFADFGGVGLLNDLDVPADVVMNFTNGRRVEHHLKSHDAVITGWGKREELLSMQIKIAGRPTETVVGSTIRGSSPRRGGPWLHISSRQPRVISSDERIRIMRAWKRLPN
jgi:hypothetical protein